MIERIDVKTARQMYEAATAAFEEAEAAILSAAVADYTPKNVADSKIKKKDTALSIELQPTDDILAELGRRKKANQLLIGFALETDNEQANAEAKLKRKNLDFIVLNSLRDAGAGFGVETNKVTIIDSLGNIDSKDLKAKSEVAEDIVEKMISMMNAKH